jgi:DHA2 family multidrug resistance protein
MQQLFSSSGPGLSEMRAYGVIEQTLSTQAALWSYVDDFRYLALACFFCIPIVLFLKRVRARGGPSLAH